MAPTYAPSGPLPNESEKFPVAAIVVLAIVGYIVLFIIGIIIRKCIITKGEGFCPVWFSELCQCQNCCNSSGEAGCLTKCAETFNWNVPNKRRCMDTCCPTKQWCDNTFCCCFSQQPEGECCNCNQSACGECGECFDCTECKECCDGCKCECCTQPETIDCCCIEWNPWACSCQCKSLVSQERRTVDDIMRFLDDPTATQVFRENASLIIDKIQSSPYSVQTIERQDSTLPNSVLPKLSRKIQSSPYSAQTIEREDSTLPNSVLPKKKLSSRFERVSRVYTMESDKS